MIQKEACFYLGKVVKPYSYKGSLLIKLDGDMCDVYEGLDTVFIAIQDHLVPFSVTRSQLHKSSLLRVKLEGITNDADANALVKSEVYLPLELLPKLEGNAFYFHEVVGFVVKDEHYGYVGTIVGVNDCAAQPFFQIDRDGKEVLIPVTDAFIVTVDRPSKTIVVKTPEGLIDLYL